MNGCGRVRHDLAGLAVGGLEPHERAAASEHAQRCPDCRAELDDLREVVGALELLRSPEVSPPAALRDRVLPRRRRPRRNRAVAAAAAVVLLVVVGGVGAPERSSVPASTVALQAAALHGEAVLTQTVNGVRIDLDVAGLEPADRGYYHAWLHRGDHPVSAGTFVGAADGTGTLQLSCGGELDAYRSMSITWHPSGGEGTVAVQTSIEP